MPACQMVLLQDRERNENTKCNEKIDGEYKSLKCLYLGSLFWIYCIAVIFQGLPVSYTFSSDSPGVTSGSWTLKWILLLRWCEEHHFLTLDILSVQVDRCRYIIGFITHLHPCTVQWNANFCDSNCRVLHTHGCNRDPIPACAHQQKQISQRRRPIWNTYSLHFVNYFDRQEVK